MSGEQRASRGFLAQANAQLQLLHVMSETEQVARCLTIPPLGRRTTATVSMHMDMYMHMDMHMDMDMHMHMDMYMYMHIHIHIYAHTHIHTIYTCTCTCTCTCMDTLHQINVLLLQMLGFLNTLCGPNASNLKVQDMDKYSFDPTHLVLQISAILVRAWDQDHTHPEPSDGVVTCLSAHPDYSQVSMKKCTSVLQMSTVGTESIHQKFTKLIEKVRNLRERTGE